MDHAAGGVALALLRSAGVSYLLQNHSSDLSVFAKLGAPGRALARRVLRGSSAFFCVNARQGAFAEGLLPGLRPTILPMGVAADLGPAAGSKPLRSARFAEGDVEGMPVSMPEALVSGRQVLAYDATNVRLLPE